MLTCIQVDRNKRQKASRDVDNPEEGNHDSTTKEKDHKGKEQGDFTEEDVITELQEQPEQVDKEPVAPNLKPFDRDHAQKVARNVSSFDALFLCF